MKASISIGIVCVAILAASAGAAAAKAKNQPPKGFLDLPIAGNVTGMARAAGWAVDEDGAVARVELLLDGKPFQKVELDHERPDVCAKYKVAACPKVGFQAPLDFSKVKKGKHVLALQITDKAGTKITVGTRDIEVD